MAQSSEKASSITSTGSRTRSLVFVALSVAIIAVSAWITIPLGPVPFTLQMFAIAFAIFVLTPRQCMATIVAYLALGAIGIPVFSGMRGGFGMFAGPTGGFLWGYLIAVPLASMLLTLLRKRGFDNWGTYLVAGIVFTAISYVCGWAQYMTIAQVSPLASFTVTVAPFIVVDVVKIVCAAFVARAVMRAVPNRV